MSSKMFMRYGVAIFTVGAALLITLSLEPLHGIPSTFFYAAVLLSTWYGGHGPGLLAIVVSFFALDYFLIHPDSLLFASKENTLQMGAFLTVALLINWLTSSRQQAQASAGESQQFIKVVADSTPNILYVFDLEDRRNVYVNSGIVKNLGYTPEEIHKMGNSLVETLMHPEDLPRWQEYTRQFYMTKNGEVFDFEYRMKHKAGDWRWLWSRESIFKRSTDGRPQQILGTAQDITKRKKAEAERERFFAVGGDLLFIAGFDGYFKWLSPAWVRALGWSSEELTSNPWLHFVHPEDQEKTIAEGKKLFAGQETVSFENRYSHKDGSYRWISWRVRPFIEEHSLYGSATDITERKQLEEQFRQSQKLESVGQLAGGIAHDFNNLLTVITGYSDLILARSALDDSARQRVEEIRKAGERAAALTRQLLAFSRKQVLEPKVLDLSGAVANMDKMLQRLIGEDVHLVTMLDPRLKRVKADPGQIEQVIMNLAVNARDAMPQGGKLTIETKNVYLDETYANHHMAVTPGPHVMLAVSDTGHGMDSKTLLHIFEPFFTTKEQGKGTGLGLAMVYGIVKQSGGNIWVYSEPGQGTTFKIYLPVVDEGESTESEAVVPERERGTETILLVEDEESVRQLLLDILEAEGYRVLVASRGDEALQVCEQHNEPIHLLMTDVVMPGMSGRQLVERLTKRCVGVKVLYMSGYTDDAIVHHGVLDPGLAFLQKPFTPDAMLRKIREVLDEA